MPSKAKKTTVPSELQIALDNRAFEIQLFWQRSNYFLVLITALGIGVFSIKEQGYALLIAVAATWSSVFWFKTNLGSRFWQESWEAEVVFLAKELGIKSFERPADEIKLQVENELNGIGSKKSFVRRWVDRQILKKPSVSYNMILLSIFSICLWAYVSIILTWALRDSWLPVCYQLTDFIKNLFSRCG
jgi:hypothetical protein